MTAIGILLILCAILCGVSIPIAGVIGTSKGDSDAAGWLILVTVFSAAAFLLFGILVLCLRG